MRLHRTTLVLLHVAALVLSRFAPRCVDGAGLYGRWHSPVDLRWNFGVITFCHVPYFLGRKPAYKVCTAVCCALSYLTQKRQAHMKRARDLGGLMATSRRQEGVAKFARELEKRFGRIEDLFEGPEVDVITASALDRTSLEALFAHRACAVHVPGFYPAEAAAEAARRLERQSTQNWKVSSPRGLESSDVLSVGKPYNVAAQEGSAAVEGECTDIRITLGVVIPREGRSNARS